MENESRRRGGFPDFLSSLSKFFHHVEPARVPSPSAKEEEGVSPSAAEPGTHKGSL